MPHEHCADASRRRTRGQPLALSISDIAERTGLTIRAIRLYEEKGLLKPARDHHGMRWFDAPTTRRIMFIAQAREAGFSLAEIKVLAEPASRSAVERLVTRKLEAVDVQRNALLRCCRMLSVGADRAPGPMA